MKRLLTIMFSIFGFSAGAFSAQPFGVEWVKLYEVNIPPGWVDKMVELSGEVRADFLMLRTEQACQIQLNSIFSDYLAIDSGHFFDDTELYNFMRFSEQVSLSKVGFRAFRAYSGPVSGANKLCAVSLYSGVRGNSSGGGGSVTPIPDPISPEYLDCEKVSTEIKYYARDFIESASVLEDTVDGKLTCRVFVRFENLSKFLKFSEFRKNAGKNPEFEIINNINNQPVRVDFDFKVL